MPVEVERVSENRMSLCSCRTDVQTEMSFWRSPGSPSQANWPWRKEEAAGDGRPLDGGNGGPEAVAKVLHSGWLEFATTSRVRLGPEDTACRMERVARWNLLLRVRLGCERVPTTLACPSKLSVPAGCSAESAKLGECNQHALRPC